MKSARIIAAAVCMFLTLILAAACSSGMGYHPAGSPAAPMRTTHASSAPRSTAAPRTSSTPRPTVTPRPAVTPRPSRRPAATPGASDPYDVHDYSHPDDFYYDHRDDFLDYEDAEDYFNDHDGFD